MNGRTGGASGDAVGGYEEARSRALGSVAGTVLEIGAGTGGAFEDLPREIDWIGLEPDRRLHPALGRAAAEHGHGAATLLAAPAERIPLPDASVDVVVSVLTLCSVRDQRAVLAEVLRVLRPGGALVVVEHVASPRGTVSSWLQHAWAPFSRRFDGGCDPTRETWRALRAARFHDVQLEWFTREPFPGVYRDHIVGRAVAP